MRPLAIIHHAFHIHTGGSVNLLNIWRQPCLMASVLGAALLGLLGACAVPTKQPVQKTPSGDVNGDLIVPEASARMQLESNQVFVAGELTNPEVMPAYPEQLLSLRLPDQQVCVRFVVNQDGSVSGVTPLYGVPGCPQSADNERPEFVTATIQAVSRWDFFSSIRCTFPPGTPDAQKCKGPGTVAEQVAVTLAYRFLFSARDGVGSVERAKTGG